MDKRFTVGRYFAGGASLAATGIHEHMIVGNPFLTPRMTAQRLRRFSLWAVRILSLLLLVVGLRVLPLQAAAASGLISPITKPESATPARGAAQGPPPPTVTGGATTSNPSGASAVKTAQQWMAEGVQAQKAGNQVEAINDFLNAQRLEPTSPDPLYSLGMSFFLIGWDENDSYYY